MSDAEDRSEPVSNEQLSISRRTVLLGGTALAASFTVSDAMDKITTASPGQN
jgi:hypothetical protein